MKTLSKGGYYCETCNNLRRCYVYTLPRPVKIGPGEFYEPIYTICHRCFDRFALRIGGVISFNVVTS